MEEMKAVEPNADMHSQSRNWSKNALMKYNQTESAAKQDMNMS